MDLITISIAENVAQVLERVKDAELKYGRREGEVRIVGISKTFDAMAIIEAVNAGITDIGENRIQEAERKFPNTVGGFKKHMVGHLQSNKVSKALRLFDVIHSVDSLKLAVKIASVGGNDKELLLEVNTSGEETKFGVRPEETLDLLSEITETTELKMCGLMTVGPRSTDESKIRSAFRKLKSLYDSASGSNIEGIEMKYLSMGMTNDFEIAIEEGSTMVRIGRAIFGERAVWGG